MTDNNQTEANPLSDEAMPFNGHLPTWQEATRRARFIFEDKDQSLGYALAENQRLRELIAENEKDHELSMGDLKAHIEDLTKAGQYLQKEVEQQEADNKHLREIAFSLLNALRLYAPDAVHLVEEARKKLEGKE